MPKCLFQAKKKRDDVEIRFQYAKQFFFFAFQILQKAKQSIHRFIFTVRSRSNPMKYNKFFQFNDFPCAPRFKANIAIEQWRGYQPNDRRVPFTKITPIFDKCFFFLFGWIFGSDDQTFAYLMRCGWMNRSKTHTHTHISCERVSQSVV